MGSMTAPVEGSWGEPAWTARVPKPWTGVGGRGGVVTGSEVRGGDMAATMAAVSCSSESSSGSRKRRRRGKGGDGDGVDGYGGACGWLMRAAVIRRLLDGRDGSARDVATEFWRGKMDASWRVGLLSSLLSVCADAAVTGWGL